MSFLKKLFGGGEAKESETPGEDYNGFIIYVSPIKEAQGYRVAARIEKDGKVHQMVRADVVSGVDEARATTLLKAKALIDQQGDHIF